MNSSDSNWTLLDESRPSLFITVWMVHLTLITGIISIIGFILNILILITMPRKAVHISRIAKMYFLLAAIGDLLIMWKTFWAFIISFLAVFDKSPFYQFIISIEYFWKIVMTLWLEGETLSNYAVFILSLERVTSIIYPICTKKILKMQVQMILLLIMLAPLLIYNGISGIILYTVQPFILYPSIKCVDIDRSHPSHFQFAFVTKLFTFSLPIFGSLLSSSLI